jgi:hypothetical protein
VSEAVNEPIRRGMLPNRSIDRHRQAARITYWIASGRRIVLLTMFIKARMREDRGDRACRAGTGPMYCGGARGG